VGTAASKQSAAAGHYYAHPGNRFWSTLYEVGITSRRYEPHEFVALLTQGIGFTDLCKSGVGMDHQIAEHPVNISAFKAKMRKYRPKAIAFTSKKAASFFFEQPTKTIPLGRQKPNKDFPAIFVLSSTSGAAASHWTVQPWHELAAWIRNPNISNIT
jgi:TDG/mug DNA glycosylase family protein